MPAAPIGTDRQMLPALDTPTLQMLSAMAGLAGALLLARGGAQATRDDGDGAWPALLAATVLQAAASLGQALRGELPPFVVFSVVKALQILTLACLWLGVRRISGRRQSLWLAAVPPSIWLVACLLPGFITSQQARIALFAPLSLVLMAGVVRDLLRLHRREGLRAALDLALIVGLVALGLVGPYVEALLIPRPFGNGWGIVGRIAALLLAIYGVTLPFLILAMRRERERATLEARRAEAIASGRAEVERLHQRLPAIIFLREFRPDSSFHLIYRGGDMGGVSGWPAERLAAPDGPLSGPSPDGWTLEAHMRRALQLGMAQEEWRLVQPDGSYRTFRSQTRPLGHTADGGVELVGYTLDVTQERLADARAIAAMRLASLGEMGKGLAHEVKQPLQALSLAAEVALGDPAPMVLGAAVPMEQVLVSLLINARDAWPDSPPMCRAVCGSPTRSSRMRRSRCASPTPAAASRRKCWRGSSNPLRRRRARIAAAGSPWRRRTADARHGRGPLRDQHNAGRGVHPHLARGTHRSLGAGGLKPGAWRGASAHDGGTPMPPAGSQASSARSTDQPRAIRLHKVA